MVRLKRLRGFTLVELLTVVAIIGILIALLLPAVQAAREAARRSQCINNLKQLSLALQNYHDQYKCFPFMRGGTYTGDPLTGNENCLSGFVPMLPFFEQGPLYDMITNNYTNTAGTLFPPWGPAPWIQTYEPWRTQIGAFFCPSDREGMNSWNEAWEPGLRNYVMCVGDSIENNHWDSFGMPRGLFSLVNKVRTFGDITDGSSNTIALSERVIGIPNERLIRGNVAGNLSGMPQNPSLCKVLKGARGQYNAAASVIGADIEQGSWYESGRRWPDGRPFFSGFTTVLPPNSPSCTWISRDHEWGIYSPTSNHPGGIIASMADGSVRFISETIDAGDPTRPEPRLQPSGSVFRTVSPYGVWGALGTIKGGEPISNF